MNARQKAKYYKRKYEELANMPIQKFKVEQHKIETIKVRRALPGFMVIEEPPVMREKLKRDIAFDIAEEIGNYMIYTEIFNPHINGYEFIGELSVVRRQE